ncbi:MAG TPA: hypothetical protein IAC04_08390 [Candidatus Coprenecus stercoravium]|uniref:Tetratricopeptide repeat protein n=1 Tax=Candidatus Coprenecus stercoravium TaxID=2840735 RepID=A0A9D2KAP5_9BACT|nr:hypothetical protein [Candidatus Coprenecus stercoravium]
MKVQLTIFCASLLLSAAVSCTCRTGSARRILETADSLMMTDPGAALDTLMSLDSSAAAGLRRSDRAFYSLLRTEAGYKCYLPVDLDTAVFAAADYYRRRGPSDLYARALIMRGAVLSERGDPVSALESYKEAEPLIERSGDLEQLGLLHTRIGDLYAMTFSNNRLALDRYRKALVLFDSVGSERRLPYANLTVARVMISDSVRTAYQYIMAGIDGAERLGDSVCLLGGFELLSWYHIKIGAPEAALQTALPALQVFHDSVHFLPPIILGYVMTGESDNAEKYLSSMPINTAVDSMMYSYLMSEVARGRKDWKTALQWRDVSSRRKDSLMNAGNMQDLGRKETYYAAQNRQLQLQTQRRGAMIAMLSAISGFVVLSLVSLIVYFKVSRRHSRQIHNLSSNYVELLDRTLTIYRKGNVRTFYDKFTDAVYNSILAEGGVSNLRRIFEMTKPGFLKSLKKRYSNLSESDIDIIVMQYYGLNTASMAALTKRNESALYTAKSRILQKTGTDKNLADFINDEIIAYTSIIKH